MEIGCRSIYKTASTAAKANGKKPDVSQELFSREMIRDDINSSSGFGIYSIQAYSERPWLLVNCDDLTISIVPSSVTGPDIFSVEPIASWTFSEYCELNLDNSSPWIYAEPWAVLLPDGE